MALNLPEYENNFALTEFLCPAPYDLSTNPVDLGRNTRQILKRTHHVPFRYGGPINLITFMRTSSVTEARQRWTQLLC